MLLLGVACKTVKPFDKESPNLKTRDAGDQAPHILKSVKCVIPTPNWYQKLWLDINAEYNFLGIELMKHYMKCSGENCVLSKAQFQSLPMTIVSAKESYYFLNDEIYKRGEIREHSVHEHLMVATNLGNTLGFFRLEVKGTISFEKNRELELIPVFEGKALVKDRYDFNPSTGSPVSSWRSLNAELRVRFAHFG